MDTWGNILHFPEGTYREQMDTQWGRREVELMKLTFRYTRLASKNAEALTADEMLKIKRLFE